MISTEFDYLTKNPTRANNLKSCVYINCEDQQYNHSTNFNSPYEGGKKNKSFINPSFLSSDAFYPGLQFDRLETNQRPLNNKSPLRPAEKQSKQVFTPLKQQPQKSQPYDESHELESKQQNRIVSANSSQQSNPTNTQNLQNDYIYFIQPSKKKQQTLANKITQNIIEYAGNSQEPTILNNRAKQFKSQLTPRVPPLQINQANLNLGTEQIPSKTQNNQVQNSVSQPKQYLSRTPRSITHYQLNPENPFNPDLSYTPRATGKKTNFFQDYYGNNQNNKYSIQTPINQIQQNPPMVYKPEQPKQQSISQLQQQYQDLLKQQQQIREQQQKLQIAPNYNQVVKNEPNPLKQLMKSKSQLGLSPISQNTPKQFQQERDKFESQNVVRQNQPIWQKLQSDKFQFQMPPQSQQQIIQQPQFENSGQQLEPIPFHSPIQQQIQNPQQQYQQQQQQQQLQPQQIQPFQLEGTSKGLGSMPNYKFQCCSCVNLDQVNRKKLENEKEKQNLSAYQMMQFQKAQEELMQQQKMAQEARLRQKKEIMNSLNQQIEYKQVNLQNNRGNKIQEGIQKNQLVNEEIQQMKNLELGYKREKQTQLDQILKEQMNSKMLSSQSQRNLQTQQLQEIENGFITQNIFLTQDIQERQLQNNKQKYQREIKNQFDNALLQRQQQMMVQADEHQQLRQKLEESEMQQRMKAEQDKLQKKLQMMEIQKQNYIIQMQNKQSQQINKKIYSPAAFVDLNPSNYIPRPVDQYKVCDTCKHNYPNNIQGKYFQN